MTGSTKRLLYWAPRALCFAFALFVSIFAFDVFDGHHGFWQTALALLIHLVPTWIVLAVLAVAWRWEWTGAVLCTALGFLYIVLEWDKFPWFTYVMISGPLFLTGALFLAGWRYRAELRNP